MSLTRYRIFSAWICLAASGILFMVSTAQAAPIPSQLSGVRSYEEARNDLVKTRAVQRLTRLGLTRDDATVLVEASLAAGADKVLLETREAKPGELNTPFLQRYPTRFLRALARRGIAVDQLALKVNRQLPAEERTTLEGQLKAGQGDVIAQARIVGINYTGLLLLLLPLAAIAWVAAGGGSASGVVLAALAVGLLFVLWADPSFIFGSLGRKKNS
jgi:hypothetical protein